MRYKINETINNQFLAEFTFLNSFGYEESTEWYVDKSTLDQIDNSGDAQKSVNQACLDLFAQNKEDFFIIDNFTQFYLLQKDKNADGFDAYEKIIGDINMNGGVPGLLDDSIPVYQGLTLLRMMLKDGMFETALRYWSTDIKAIMPFPQVQIDFYEITMENLLIKYGVTQGVIDVIKSTPKGSL